MNRQPDDTVVVVADDDRHIRRLLAIMLGRMGIRVVEAPDGLSALAACRAPGVDLAILDVNMPGLSGLEILAELKAEAATATLPVLLLTADARSGSAIAGLELGAHDYLRKPFELSELQARVDAAIQLGRKTRGLAASESRYRVLLNHMPGSGVLLLDRDLRVIANGGSLLSSRGYPTEEILGRPVAQILPGPDTATLLPFYHAALAGQPSGTFEFTPISGGHYLVDAVPLDYDTGSVEHVLVAIRDVTALTLAERARERAESGYQAAFEDAPVGMAQVDLDGRLDRVNPALCALLGHTRADLEGTRLLNFVHPDDTHAASRAIDQLTSGGTASYRAERRYIHADGHPIWLAVSSLAVQGSDGQVDHLLMHYLDITDRKTFEQQLQHLADHDPLTGLLNRRGFEAELERQAAFVARYGPAGALLVLDLDYFKQINDTLGHNAGDQLIVSMAEVLRGTVRDTDIVARLGGDEFAIILPRDGRMEAELVADKILGAARGHVTLLDGRHPRTVTASMGIALFDNPQQSGQDVLIGADVSMYDAKDAGRDRFATYRTAPNSEPLTRTRLRWVDRINTALHDESLVLYAQPILDLTDDTISHYELLLRMLDENGATIAPAAFLPVAERMGLIGRIDRWVTGEAIKLLASTDLSPDTVLEVNVSGLSIGDPDLLAHLEGQLITTGADPSRLIIEITETAAIFNIDRARNFVDRLSEIGCQFAIDDFGAGFGNFYSLKHLPFDYIKIDGEFIRNCTSNSTDQLLIKSLVTIARGLGKKTIAEFVGDEHTLRFLRANGIDYAQGYHIGEPRPVASTIGATRSPSSPGRSTG